MIRPQCSLLVKPVPAQDRVTFVALIPGIQKQLRFAFRHSPAAIRQERIDDALAHAFVLFSYLVRLKRVRLAHPTALARYAACRVRSRRPIGSRDSSRDVMSCAAQRRFGFRVITANSDCGASHQRSTELLGESRQATPAELAAIRIDFAAWLDQLSERQREIALCLAIGESTGVVARKFAVSCARISQIRLELAARWHQFHGERRETVQVGFQVAAPLGGQLGISMLPGDANRAPSVSHALPSAGIRRGPSHSPDWACSEVRHGAAPPHQQAVVASQSIAH